jgi:geranylgeranyl diphosphate synthase type I
MAGRCVLDVHDVVNYINLMSTLAAASGSTPAAFLAELQRALASTLAPPAALAHAAAPMALAAEAKRARPALIVELAALAGTPLSDRLLDAALMVELMHTASLVHDDIIDGAAFRRSLPSVHASLGPSTAVLVGDDLIVRAFERIAARPPLVRAALGVLGEMVHAVAGELAARGDVALDEPRWRAIAHGKTAALFGLCGQAVGLCGRRPRPELTARLRRAGLHLGLAFQIADDLTDLASADDLLERNANLPLLRAVAAEPALAPRLRELWSTSPPDPVAARALAASAMATAAPGACLELARAELRAADALLRPLAGTDPQRAALMTVRQWGQLVIERTVGVMSAPNVPNVLNAIATSSPAGAAA